MRSLSKKSKKVIAELTRIGARMMLEVAVEDELTAFLGRDYYERRTEMPPPCVTRMDELQDVIPLLSRDIYNIEQCL